MMMSAQSPSWRQLAGCIKQPEDEVPFWKDEKYIFTHSSAASLWLIFSAYQKLSGKDEIHVFLPAYFCQETLNKIRSRGIRFFLYEIDENMEPDWNRMKEKKDIPVDLFVFCHYFGICHEVSRARNFCDQKKAVLIEDCAHVLYPAGGYGRKGDFALYSPHKVIPVPDGGIIACNKSRMEITVKIADMLAEQCSVERKDTCSGWRVKKAVQKVTHLQRHVPESDGPYYGQEKRHGRIQYKISDYSRSFIQSLTKKQLKQMAYIRRCNCMAMDWLVWQIEPGAVNIANGNAECPYAAPYRIFSDSSRKNLTKRLKALGIQPLHWPDLPAELKNETAYEIEKNLSKELIVLPVHQGVRPQEIIRCRLDLRAGWMKKRKPVNITSVSPKEDAEISLCFLKNTKEDYKRWKNVTAEICLGNIPQDWSYGSIKQKVEKWRPERAVIYSRQGKAVGILQILRKYRAGITVAVRVNRGPLFITAYNTTENKLAVMELVRKRYKHPIPVLYAPELEFTGENLARITQYGWRQWNVFGFSSGLLDLGQEEAVIRRQLDGKWRNQLKKAEKKGMTIRTDNNRFFEMLDLYENSQLEKGYEGTSRGILSGLMQHKQTPLRLLYLEDEDGEIMAFDIFYAAFGFGLYFVGWNSDQGRKCYANNFLLYQAAVRFKAEGMKWLDLGGIDYIDTEENAAFKDGMRPVHYQLIGEFIRF